MPRFKSIRETFHYILTLTLKIILFLLFFIIIITIINGQTRFY